MTSTRLPYAVTAILALALLAGCQQSQPAVAPAHPAAEASFEQTIASDGLVMVEFYRSACPSCRDVEPTLLALEAEYAGQLRLLRINVDENLALARSYRVQHLPTVLLFADEEILSRWEGWNSPVDYRGGVEDAMRAQHLPQESAKPIKLNVLDTRVSRQCTGRSCQVSAE